jgi:hypothetical protein
MQAQTVKPPKFQNQDVLLSGSTTPIGKKVSKVIVHEIFEQVAKCSKRERKQNLQRCAVCSLQKKRKESVHWCKV